MASDSQASGNRLARWLSDDSFSPRPPDLAVYRYKGMISVVPLFGVIFLSLAPPVLATLSPGRDLGGYVGFPIFAWAATSIGWLVTVGSAVRVWQDALIIDNMVVRHVIPWDRFAGLNVERSLGMFARLDDGGVVQSSSFGRSLSDAMKGYGHMRETLGRIPCRLPGGEGFPSGCEPSASVPAAAERTLAADPRAPRVLRGIRMDRVRRSWRLTAPRLSC